MNMVFQLYMQASMCPSLHMHVNVCKPLHVHHMVISTPTHDVCMLILNAWIACGPSFLISHDCTCSLSPSFFFFFWLLLLLLLFFFLCYYYYYYYYYYFLVKSIWMNKVFIFSFGLLLGVSGDSSLPTLWSTLWLFYVCSSCDLYKLCLLQVAVIKCASSWSSFMTHRGLSMIDLSLSCALWTNPWRKALSWKSIHLVAVSLHRLQPFLVLRVYLNGGLNHLTNYTTWLERIRMLFRGRLLWPPTFTQPRIISIHFLSLVVG